MQKRQNIFFISIVAFLTGCSLLKAPLPKYSELQNAPHSNLITPLLYKEVAPYNGLFGRTGVKQNSYISTVTFLNRETQEVYSTDPGPIYEGQTIPEYTRIVLRPGTYDLIGFAVKGIPVDYNQDKCGKISFTAAAGEVLFLQGIKPAAVTTPKGVFGISSTDKVLGIKNILGLRRDVAYISFSKLPAGYERQIQNLYPELIQNAQVRVIAPTSDRPEDFQACITAVNPFYTTLMDDEGAVAH